MAHSRALLPVANDSHESVVFEDVVETSNCRHIAPIFSFRVGRVWSVSLCVCSSTVWLLNLAALSNVCETVAIVSE